LVFALPPEPRRRGGTGDNRTAEARGSNVVANNTGAKVVPRGEHELLFETISRVDGEGIVLRD
jgi:hypothetical protein